MHHVAGGALCELSDLHVVYHPGGVGGCMCRAQVCVGSVVHHCASTLSSRVQALFGVEHERVAQPAALALCMP